MIVVRLHDDAHCCPKQCGCLSKYGINMPLYQVWVSWARHYLTKYGINMPLYQNMGKLGTPLLIKIWVSCHSLPYQNKG